MRRDVERFCSEEEADEVGFGELKRLRGDKLLWDSISLDGEVADFLGVALRLTERWQTSWD